METMECHGFYVDRNGRSITRIGAFGNDVLVTLWNDGGIGIHWMKRGEEVNFYPMLSE